MHGSQKGKPIVILLVEDDGATVLLLEQLLALRLRGSLQFRRADRLSTALREMTRGDVDIALLDLGLPDSQGLDTLVRLREVNPGVPIIVLTGLDDEALAEKALQQGADDYVIKSELDGKGLARAVRYAMERSRSHRALAAEHRLLCHIMDNIPDQVYLKDPSGRFLSVNAASVGFHGVAAPNQLLGKTVSDLYPPELAAQFANDDQELLSGGQASVNRAAAVRDARGDLHWLVTTKVLLRDPDGKIMGILGINRDVTAYRQAEEALREYRERLEHLVVERTAKLQRANKILRSHDKARDEFVSNVSHELKTPLAALRLALENLLSGVVCPRQNQDCRSYLDLMQRSCLRMQETVEDILDMSRIDAGTLRLNCTITSLPALVQRVVDSLQPHIATRSITLEATLPKTLVFVECDRHRMERVVLNVLGNAIKFTPENGGIRVILRSDPDMPCFLRLEIEDDGLGIPEEHLPHIGKRYFQGDHDASGTGLGLAISKEILEMHGGSLSLASPPPGKPRGTLVLIRLPALDPLTLVIVGIGDVCRRVSTRLAQYGFTTPVCRAGPDALHRMRRNKPYAAILDFSTAGLEAAGLLAQIKTDPGLQDLPLIALTETDIPETKRQILEGFAVPAWREPWSENGFLDAIQDAIPGGSRAGMAPPLGVKV